MFHQSGPVWQIFKRFWSMFRGWKMSWKMSHKCKLFTSCLFHQVLQFTHDSLHYKTNTWVSVWWLSDIIYIHVSRLCVRSKHLHAARATGVYVLLLNSGPGWYFAFYHCVWHCAQLSIGRAFRWVSLLLKNGLTKCSKSISVFWHVAILLVYHSVSSLTVFYGMLDCCGFL